MKNKFFERFMIVNITTCLFLANCRQNTMSPNRETLLTPTAINTTRYLTLKEVLDDKYYLEDCKTKYPSAYTEQASFHEVYPGVTTENELVENLGKSYIKVSDPNGYGYPELGASFDISDNIVDTIYVEPKAEQITSLQKALEKYGCPDVINAQALTDDPSEDSVPFNRTVLFYIQAGMYIDLNTYPVSYSQAVESIIFTRPSFLYTIVDFDEISKPVSFSEAIIEE